MSKKKIVITIVAHQGYFCPTSIQELSHPEIELLFAGMPDSEAFSSCDGLARAVEERYAKLNGGSFDQQVWLDGAATLLQHQGLFVNWTYFICLYLHGGGSWMCFRLKCHECRRRYDGNSRKGRENGRQYPAPCRRRAALHDRCHGKRQEAESYSLFIRVVDDV